MAILCCCGQLCPRKRHGPHTKDEPASGYSQDMDVVGIVASEVLPSRPPPARLPPPIPNANVNIPPPSPESTAARSSLTNPLPGISGATADNSIQLGELVIEDSEGDNGDGDGNDPLVHSSRNRSTSTLEAVKARIRRHLSQDSISRKSETGEQIARRAEVKRLMRKRIQEELQSETGGAASGVSTPHDPAPASITGLGNGPRDTIEFAVDQTKKDKDLARAMARSLEDHDPRLSKATSKQSSAHSFAKENCHPSSRPASLRDFDDAEADLEDFHAAHHKHLRQRSSLPDIPASPVLHPVTTRFNDAASIASWRLSLSGDKLADLLTPEKSLSVFRPVASPSASTSTLNELAHRPIRRPRSKSSPLVVRNEASTAHASQVSLNAGFRRRLTASHSLVRDESPVGLWLRTQGQQFHMSTASRPQSYADLDAASDIPVDLYDTAQDHASHIRQVDDQQCSESSRTSVSGNRMQGTPFRSRSYTAHADTKTARILSTCDLGLLLGAQPHPTELAPARPPAPTPGESPSTTLNLPAVDGNSSGQSCVRRGFGGLRLPSFRCELPHPASFVTIA